MSWMTAFRRMTRNGLDSPALGDLDIKRLFQKDAPDAKRPIGCVPIEGHGGLSARELASAGASLADPTELPTIEVLRQARERMEAFIERAVTDLSTGHLRGTYWDFQSADIDEEAEIDALAGEMQRLRCVESAAVVGWVVRNAAIRAQLPIENLARPLDEVTADAQQLAETLLDSAQRLDPTFGGYLLSPRPLRRSKRRFRERFGPIWVYGD